VPADATSLPIHQRRRARRLAYVNSGLWATGNGMVSTMLVVYLAMEFDVPGIGLGISLILAAPRIVGLLRTAAPAMIGRLADRWRFCIGLFLFSAMVLAALPLVVAPGVLPSTRWSLAALVVLWSVYHLLQFLATVALWSWLADLVPLRIRGRFLGRRERWMAAGQAVGMLGAGLYVWQQTTLYPDEPKWIAYATVAVIGAGFMVAALVPLARIPAVANAPIVRSGASISAMLAPLVDRRFLRLLLFGCLLATVNGVTQLAQGVYPGWELKLGLFAMLSLKTGMGIGQLTLGPRTGRLVDRLGNRPVMALSLLLVAQGPLFYFFATPQQPWWIVGAWIAWIGWVGVNVGLPNLLLKLSPAEANTPYIATYYALTGLCLSASTIAGGVAFDLWRDRTFNLPGVCSLDYYQAVFLLGWAGRMSVVLVLVLVVEEGLVRRSRGR